MSLKYLAVAALGIGPNDLLNDLETMGLLFETLCVRDLRVYAEANDGNVFHYRDKICVSADWRRVSRSHKLFERVSVVSTQTQLSYLLQNMADSGASA